MSGSVGVGVGVRVRVRVSVAAIAQRQGTQATISGWAFFGIAAGIFVACVTATVMACASMSAMGGVPMPGGWTMSMAWVRMCGRTWVSVAASFIGMWVVMMVAMMLPSLLHTLWRCREAIDKVAGARLSPLGMLLTAVAYFFVWSALGVGVFLLGAALAALEMKLPLLARAVPAASGLVLMMGGALQFSAWKGRHLAACRTSSLYHPAVASDRSWWSVARASWCSGLRLGLHCVCSCAGLTAILLAAGVMDLRVMAAVAAAITAERLAPSVRRVTRSVTQAIGVIAISLGLLSIVRAW